MSKQEEAIEYFRRHPLDKGKEIKSLDSDRIKKVSEMLFGHY